MFISTIDNKALIRKDQIKVISLQEKKDAVSNKYKIYFCMDNTDDYLSELYSSLDKAKARMAELRDLLCFK